MKSLTRSWIITFLDLHPGGRYPLLVGQKLGKERLVPLPAFDKLCHYAPYTLKMKLGRSQMSDP